MSNYNAFRENYPPGFDGVEGKQEETFVFFVSGEVDIEHYTEEEAEEELLDMSLRELVSKGILTIA